MSSSHRRLVPKTNLLASKRNRNWSLEGALQELCDNSLGHGAAQTIYINIDADQVAVRDDGTGMDDIDRIFTFGDSSSTGNLSEIGQFGVGATDAAVYLGADLEVTTVHKGRVYIHETDWDVIERSGLWVIAHDGHGAAFIEYEGRENFPLAQGTKVLIERPRKRWNRGSAEKVVERLSKAFMPALREGRKIHITQMPKGGKPFSTDIAAFEPPPLTDRIEISGEVKTSQGLLKWKGHAGLSDQLTEDTARAHIIFAHRVIEITSEPYMGNPGTLYTEIVLDPGSGWKYALSDHKDKIVNHREELFASIHKELEELIKKASKQATHLALKGMIVPIAADVTKALRGAGVLPAAEAEYEPVNGKGRKGPKGPRHLDVDKNGPENAKPDPPEGLTVDFNDDDFLDSKPYSWDLGPYSAKLWLNEDHYKELVGWPPKLRDERLKELIVAFISHAVEIEFSNRTNPGAIQAFAPRLRRDIEKWGQQHEIAPRLHAELLGRVKRIEKKEKAK